MQAAAVVVVLVLTPVLAGTAGLPVRRVAAALTALVGAAVAGATLGAPSFHPTAGLRYPGTAVGVAIGVPLAAWLLRGTASLRAFGDLLAAPLAFGAGIAKTGCFFHGCCHGPVAALPWAVPFPHRSVPWFEHLQAGRIDAAAPYSLPVHPLQLYLAAWAMMVGVFLLVIRKRTTYDGQSFLVLVTGISTGWFMTEQLKVPQDPGLRFGTLVVAIVGTVALVALRASDRVRVSG
jgi:prolipoprotein diacylglyceryltransferase